MGLANDEEARPSTSDVEETLPLYQESEERHQLPSLVTPAPTATPDEVRDFVVQVMQARGIGLDHARRVAARWTLGSGHELREYPVAMYRDIFGPEDGWMVYKGVRSIYYKEKNERRWSRWVHALLAIASAGICFGGIALMANLENIAVGWFFVGMLLMGSGMVSALVFMVIATSRVKPDEQAENELQANWSKSPSAK